MTRAAHVLLALVTLSCGADRQRPMRLDEVSPKTAPEGSAAQLELLGEFPPVVMTSFRRAELNRVSARFEVSLERSGHPPLHLTDVQRRDDGVLLGTVPSTAPQAAFDVRVLGPDGESVLLTEGFRVLAPASAVAAFELSSVGDQRVGVPFKLGITAVDDQGRVVDGFAGNVQLTDTTGTAAATSLGPFTFGRLGTQVTVSSEANDVRLTVADAAGRLGVTEPFAVRAGAATRLRLQLPSSAVAGECLQGAVTIEDVNGRLAPAPQPLRLALASGGSSLTFFSDAACATESSNLSVAEGGTGTRFSLRARRAGPLTVRAGCATLPSASTSLTVSAAAPAGLGFSTAAQAVAQSACSAPVELRVEDAHGNETTAPATTAQLAASSGSNLTFYADASCATAISAVPVGAAAARFFVRAASAGTFSFTATAPSLAAASQLLQVTP